MKILYKIISPVFVFLLAAIVFFVIYSQAGLEQALIRETYLRIADDVTRYSQQQLTGLDINQPDTGVAQLNFSELSKSIADPSIARFTIWDTSSHILFSDLQSIIGYRGTPRPEVQQAAQRMQSFYQIKNQDSGSPVQTSVGRFVDIYIPIQIDGEVIVVEVHAVANAILAPLQEQVTASVIALAGGGAVIILVLLVITQIFVTNPLDALSSAFKAFSYGDLNYPVKVRWKDEIGLLSKNVDAMRQNLQFTIKELKEERDQSAAIVSSTGEGVIVIDKGYKITLMNQAAEKLLGLVAAQHYGKKLTDVIEVYRDGQQVPLSQWAATRAFKTGKTTIYTFEDKISYKTYKGKVFPTVAAVAPLLRKGTTRGAVVIFRDITQDKQLDEAKVNFISIASHQLRTPLTSMRWFSEMLLQKDAGKLQPQQEHFVNRVYQGVIRMIGLVNLLLQTARVEAGRVSIDPTPIDLKAFTNEVIDSLKADLDAKALVVSVSTKPASLPPVEMDRDMLWQVVLNLLSNASRYSPKGSTIAITITDKDDNYEFSVKDSGIGIPQAEQAHIFEKFYRAKNALQAVPEGSGLGLSLVLTLVKDWGGKISFESTENKGTTFYFTIPKQGVKARKGEVKLVV